MGISLRGRRFTDYNYNKLPETKENYLVYFVSRSYMYVQYNKKFSPRPEYFLSTFCCAFDSIRFVCMCDRVESQQHFVSVANRKSQI